MYLLVFYLYYNKYYIIIIIFELCDSTLRHGVVRQESVMELRQRIEELGKMEGVQEKEKGESHIKNRIPITSFSFHFFTRSRGALKCSVQENTKNSTFHRNQVNTTFILLAELYSASLQYYTMSTLSNYPDAHMVLRMSSLSSCLCPLTKL